jgi:hypothetical protein
MARLVAENRKGRNSSGLRLNRFFWHPFQPSRFEFCRRQGNRIDSKINR